MSQLFESLFGTKQEPGWQCRELRFDCLPRDLACCPGEHMVEMQQEVEDCKGNPGDSGCLTITNQRITWAKRHSPGTNLSIGHGCVIDAGLQDISSRLRGSSSALRLLTRANNQRYEFMFSASSLAVAGLLQAMQAVLQAFEASLLYRELKLRGAFLAEGQLLLLPREQLQSRVAGVWNLSSETGSLGTLNITTVRLVWHSNLSPGLNVSIPYLQVQRVRVRDSKFGPALVVETSGGAGGSYVLGFKIDPREALDAVHQEVASLWQAYQHAPEYGVEYAATLEARQRMAEEAGRLAAGTPLAEEPQVSDAAHRQDRWAAAYGSDEAQGGKGACTEPVYSPDLGLAVEPLQGGASIQDLWAIL